MSDAQQAKIEELERQLAEAREAALEEAAKVADKYREEAGGSQSYNQACEHIASMIRLAALSPSGIQEG